MEKFALLNLLSALSSLAPKQSEGQPSPTETTEAASAPYEAPRKSAPAENPPAENPPATYPNVMASVLERHEAISNRIKNKR